MEEDDIASQNDAAACSKLWDIYVREAQAYDEGLIKSWKEDMDITLVFSGLYSAILTAFVIESYRNLQPNPSEDSAILLKRISQQLSNPSNSSGLAPFPANDEFSPTPSALVCNILWFISLALALTCAFLATLVQQWSRRFLHRTSTVRSSSAHAHLLQYLYFGLKDLKMHVIVDLIPSLLHISLFSFFAGLIGFLHDVNTVLTRLFAVFLALLLLVYWAFTLLPLVNLSSPYATPLSPILWKLWQITKASTRSLRILEIRKFLSRLTGKRRSQGAHAADTGTRPPNDEEAHLSSITEKSTSLNIQPHIKESKWSMIDAGTRESQKRCHTHESRSIIWTFSSLRDDEELLSFLEVLPDVLLGDNLDGLREGNLHLIDALLTTGDIQTSIVSRTLSLVENAKNPWNTTHHRERCSIACAKALYSLARVLVDHKYRNRFIHHTTGRCPSLFSEVTLDRVKRAIESNALEPSFSTSALVLCVLSILQSLRDRISACPDQHIPRTWFQKVETLMSHHFSTMLTEWAFHESLTQPQAEVTIREMISSTFYCYLRDAIYKPSFNLVKVCDLLVQNGGNLFEIRNSFYYLFHALSQSIQRPDGRTSIECKDTIFGFALDCLQASTSTLGNELAEILDYISGRFNMGGWGSTTEIWSGSGRLHRLIDYFQNSDPSLIRTAFSLDPALQSALQELLLHTVNTEIEDIQSFLEQIFFNLHSRLQKENTSKSHLWFFAVFVLLEHFQWSDTEVVSSILDKINEELHPDDSSSFTHTHIENEAAPELITILHCLRSSLSMQQTRDILQFFFHCFPRNPYRNVMGRPYLLSELVKQSEHLAVLFLQAPSEELMEITAMVWSFWWEVLPESIPCIDNAEAQITWSKLARLSNFANQLLSPEGRRVVQCEIAKSTSKQQHTILSDSNLKRLDLLHSAELVQIRLRPIIHLLIPLPSADADEETEIVTSCDGAS